MWIKLKPSLHFCQAESNFESLSVRVEARNKMEAQIFFLKMRKDVNQICFSNSKIEEFSLDLFYRSGLESLFVCTSSLRDFQSRPFISS